MIVDEYLERIENVELREKVLKIYDYLETKYDFSLKPAAKTHHHNYEGGLTIHTEEVIRNILLLNKEMKAGFSNDEVILVAYLHDLMKAYSYRFDGSGNIQIIDFPATGEAIVFRLCAKFGLVLSFDQLSAIEFAHGGWSYTARVSKIEPSKLANLLHCADLLSQSFGIISKEKDSEEK